RTRARNSRMSGGDSSAPNFEGLCHTPRHKTPTAMVVFANFRGKLARRTGRFPQLAHPRSSVNRPDSSWFARVSHYRHSDHVGPNVLLPLFPGAPPVPAAMLVGKRATSA